METVTRSPGRAKRWAAQLGAFTALVLTASAVLAQQPGAANEGSTIIVSSRSLYVEGFIVVLMCGAALYAVCRTSGRN